MCDSGELVRSRLRILLDSKCCLSVETVRLRLIYVIANLPPSAAADPPAV